MSGSGPTLNNACPANVSRSDGESIAFGKAMYGLGWIIILICYAVFVWAKRNRRFARLETRHALLTHILCIGGLIQLQIDPLALMIGRENYMCGAVVLQFTMIPLIGGPVLARLLSFYFRSRFESQAVSTYRTSVRKRFEEKRSDLGLIDENGRRLSIRGITQAFAFGFHEAFLLCKSSDSKLTLRALRFLQSGHGISFLIFVVLLAPSVLAAIVIAATQPAIQAGCMGCWIPSEVYSFLIAQGTLISAMTIVLLARIWIKGFPDKWGIINETALSVVFASLAMLGYVLLIFAPASKHFYFVFLIEIGIWGLVIVQTVLQVYLSIRRTRIDARKWKRAYKQSISSATLNSGHYNLDVVLASKPLAKAFEEHLQREFGVESLFFYQEVQSWKQSYGDTSPPTRASRARKIIRNFISPDGIFCINIPADTASFIIQSAENDPLGMNGFPRIDVFDEAMHEIKDLLEMGALARFKRSNTFKTLIAEGLQHLVPVEF